MLHTRAHACDFWLITINQEHICAALTTQISTRVAHVMHVRPERHAEASNLQTTPPLPLTSDARP